MEPPVTSSNIPLSWSRVDSFVVQLTAISSLGISKTYYTTDGTEPTTSSLFGPNQPENITQFIVSGQGQFVIKYFSVDALGNTEPKKSQYLKLDNVSPVSQCLPSFSSDGQNGWYINNPLITLSATDQVSGIKNIYYRWGSTGAFLTYSAPFSIPSEGIFSLQFFAVDNAENSENVNIIPFFFDNEPPVTQDDAPSETQKQPITITFFTSDNVSGIQNTYYTTDGTTPTTSSSSGSSVTLSNSGTYIIQYFSVDFAGNQEVIKQSEVQVTIDTQAPYVYISEDHSIDGKNGWYIKTPAISLAATDPSGIQTIQYRLYSQNQSTTAKYISPVNISSSIDLSVNYYINLQIDNGEALQINVRGVVPLQTTITEIIDIINATVGQTVAFQTGSDSTPGLGHITIVSPTSGAGSTSSEVGFLQPTRNDATNAIFGLDETSYPHTFAETAVFTSYVNSITLPYDSFWTLECFAVDNQGNKGDTQTKNYKLDSQCPITQVSTIPVLPDGDNNWFITNPQITLPSTDIISGVFKTLYQWDSDPIQQYTKSFQAPSKGSHDLKVYSIDIAGNIENVKHTTIKFDDSTSVTTDDTILYQGIIITSRCSGYQKVAQEQITSSNSIIPPNQFLVSNPDVVSATYIYNSTKSQEYVQQGRITSIDFNRITVNAITRNENPTILGPYQIRLQNTPSSYPTDYSSVLRICDVDNGTSYTVDTESSVGSTLSLFGKKPINAQDTLQVDYTFELPLSTTDVLEVTYNYNVSHDPEVLNTHNYTLVTPLNRPYVLDTDVTIVLSPTNIYSGSQKTYYTIDGSIPTTNSYQGTEVHLTESGTYIIKYFSVSGAGIVEPVKQASYSITIDKTIPHLTTGLTPANDGENGWYKTAFSVQSDIWSEDKISIYNENAIGAPLHRIQANVNDKLDFFDTIQHTITIPANTYTTQGLANQIQSLIGSPYTVTVDFQRSIFHINSTSNFSLLWHTGPNSSKTIAKTLGFNPTIDSTGFSSYSSCYFTFSLSNDFVKSVELIRTSSGTQLSFVEITKGAQGFYNDIVVTAVPLASTEDILIDYTHYIGIEKVNYGLDNSGIFPLSIIVINDEGKFLGIDTVLNRVIYRITLSPTTLLFAQDGQHTIWSQAFDNNSSLTTGSPQKASALARTDFKLDRVSPITTDDVKVHSGWYNIPVTVKLLPVDNSPGSGVAETHYTIDGSNPTRFSQQGKEIVLDASGTYVIKYFSIDFAGNIEPVETSQQINIDLTAPYTSLFTCASPTNLSPITPDGNNEWFKSVQPYIAFNATDTQSGIKHTYYEIDSTGFVQYLSPFAAPQGATTITFYSIDNVGNTETHKNAEVKYDSVAPITTTNLPATGYTSNPTVNFSVFDESSGLDTTYFTIDGTDPDFTSQHGSSIQFHSTGNVTIKFFSVDLAGNRETTQTILAKFDLDPPVISNFEPVGCIISDTTTQISFTASDVLSGVDINSVIVTVDNIQYSTKKNNNYFFYTGTSSSYVITIKPIEGLVNFQDIDVVVVSIKDLAGNADTLEHNFTHPDSMPPWVREVYPAPNVKDVSTNTNIIAFIDDDQSGVDIKSVSITINNAKFNLVTRNVLAIRYTGSANTATVLIYNYTLSTFINGQRDVYFSFYDSSYDTIQKIQNYFNSLPNYSATVLDSKYDQQDSSNLVNVPSTDITSNLVLVVALPVENLNFSFIERNNGYVVFVSPLFNFQHLTPVNVIISASDNSGNSMVPFSYIFVPHIYATPSVKKRNYLNTIALDYIKNIQTNIASNYSRSRSTNFYGHHKAMSLELARHYDGLNDINSDRSYSTLNPIDLFNKLGYLLYTTPYTDQSHDDYRNMLQALISIFFKGSLKTSIESAIQLYTGSQVNVVELVFTQGSDISEQFMFTIDVIIDQNTSVDLDLNALSVNIDNILALVKPAHIFAIKRFVWSDYFDTQTKISDLYSISSEYLESDDVRENCQQKLEKITTYIEDVSIQFNGSNDSFYTYNSPLLKDATTVATVNDIIVTVNGIQASILSFDPLTGYIQLSFAPAYDSIVVVTYNYNKYFVYREITFRLNDYTVSGNDFVSSVNSILNHSNIYEVVGGILIPPEDLRLHAHVCETFVDFTFKDLDHDAYETPDCNNNRVFYLNNYSVDGVEFDQEIGSYLNNAQVQGISATQLFYIEIDDKKQEIIDVPSEHLSSLSIQGDFTSETGFIPEDIATKTKEKQYSYTLHALDSTSDFYYHFGLNFKDQGFLIDKSIILNDPVICALNNPDKVLISDGKKENADYVEVYIDDHEQDKVNKVTDKINSIVERQYSKSLYVINSIAIGEFHFGMIFENSYTKVITSTCKIYMDNVLIREY